MAEDYRIREARIRIQPGVVLIAEVSTINGLKSLLRDLQNEQIFAQQQRKESLTTVKKVESQVIHDDPLERMAIRAGLPTGVLKDSNVLAIKDGLPQLLRPSAFGAVTEATLLLLYSVEVGMKVNPVDFDAFKGIYDAQNIKSGSPLPVLLTNLRNGGYINKELYLSHRQVQLTAKGEKKAIEVMKAQLK
jgi:hypothetical protein